MKLTAEQITIIEKTLVLNGLKFEDLKLEVTDHIASEIEELMSTNSLPFEENLKVVFSKWSEQLRPSSSIRINRWYFNRTINPSLATYKFDKWVKKTMLLSVVLSLLFAASLTLTTRNWHSEVILDYLKLAFKTVSFSVFILLVFASYKIWKSKHITTYGYLFNRNVFIQIFYLFFLSMGIFPFRIYNGDFGSDLVFNFFPLAILCISIFYLKLAYDHIQFDKKLSNL